MIHAIRLSAFERDVLAAFARGYLHQDAIEDHGSATAAASAFAADADDDERRRVADALDRLIDAARHQPLATLQHYFTSTVGAAWTPTSVDDLAALARAIRQPR